MTCIVIVNHLPLLLYLNLEKGLHPKIFNSVYNIRILFSLLFKKLYEWNYFANCTLIIVYNEKERKEKTTTKTLIVPAMRKVTL